MIQHFPTRLTHVDALCDDSLFSNSPLAQLRYDTGNTAAASGTRRLGYNPQPTHLSLHTEPSSHTKPPVINKQIWHSRREKKNPAAIERNGKETQTPQYG